MRFNQQQVQKILDQSIFEAKTEEPIAAVGYCRFSSDMQNENSIEAQKRAITEYAEKNNYNIVDWYVDRAYSGKTVNRPDFQRLLKDITTSDCKFTVVLVHKMDRFSRNAADTMKYKDILHDYGIELISTVEKIRNDANGRLLFGIMSNINQFYVENLGNEVAKGLREIALEGKWTGGIPPLGYNVVDQRLVINEAEAIIVRKIFEMAAEGNGYNTIIREMNDCGYLTKAGKPFGKNSLYSILNNEKYKGVYLYNRCARRSSKNTRNSHKYKDESEIIRFEDGVPAIVSKELWNRANASRKIVGQTTTNAKHHYLLSGLLYCGECGAKMHGNHRLYNQRGYNTYRCNKNTNQLKCNCKEIRADLLENFVINALTEHFFNPSIIQVITEQINQKATEIKNRENQDTQLAKSSLNGLIVARNNLLEAIAQGGFHASIAEKLDHLERQILHYETLIKEHEMQLSVDEITCDEVAQKIGQIKDIMKNPKNITQTKILLRSYIERVVVDNNSVKVIFKVTFSFFCDEKRIEVSYTHTENKSRKLLKS